MRFRPGKWGILARKSRGIDKGFAYWPKKLSNGTWVWLETYHRYSGYYGLSEEK
tara:strand:- start:299 stop:460 length:162 start_codon:yes stop_codon:yes gene_type:complete